MYRRAAPFKLIVRSEGAPVTAAQVLHAARAFLRCGLRAEVNLIELTFDLRCITILYLRRRLLTRARRYHCQSEPGTCTTLYLGAPRSPWQVRVYQKTASVVRVELILRRAFLKTHNVCTLDDLLLLGRLDLSHLIRVPDIKPAPLNVALRKASSDWRKTFLPVLLDALPVGNAAEILRKEYGLPLKKIFQPSAVERLLTRMQRRLVW